MEKWFGTVGKKSQMRCILHSGKKQKADRTFPGKYVFGTKTEKKENGVRKESLSWEFLKKISLWQNGSIRNWSVIRKCTSRQAI